MSYRSDKLSSNFVRHATSEWKYGIKSKQLTHDDAAKFDLKTSPTVNTLNKIDIEAWSALKPVSTIDTTDCLWFPQLDPRLITNIMQLFIVNVIKINDYGVLHLHHQISSISHSTTLQFERGVSRSIVRNLTIAREWIFLSILKILSFSKQRENERKAK